MKKILVLSLAALLVTGSFGLAFATNGYQLIGVGQIQKSMGGAVTAAPLDAMTAISNPAGMARIGSRADFSMEAFMPKRSVDFTGLGMGMAGGESTEGGSKMYGIPAIGWTAPAFGRDDMYFGGGMYGTSGLGVDYDELNMMTGPALDFMFGAPGGTYEDVTFSGYSAIQFWKMAPTVAWNVNEKLTLGGALNLDYQSVAIVQKFRNVPLTAAGQAMYGGAKYVDINFDLGRPTSQMGYGFTVGALYDLNDTLTFGASYSSKQTFGDAEFRVGTNDILNYAGAVGKAGTYAMDLQYPQQFALGVAYKPTAELLIDFDVKWINWSDTHDNVAFSGPSGAFMTSGGPVSSIDLPFGWEDQWVYALGAQYALNEKVNLRAGFNYAEMPIDEADVFNNLVFPAIVERHIAVGADYKFDDHWSVAGTYMHAWSESLTGTGDVSKDMQQVFAFQEDSDIAIELEEKSIGMQVSYLF
jgi:long-chain fatty acid transport protein